MSTAFAAQFNSRDTDRIPFGPGDSVAEWFAQRTRQIAALTRLLLPERTHNMSNAEVRNLWVEKMQGRKL